MTQQELRPPETECCSDGEDWRLQAREGVGGIAERLWRCGAGRERTHTAYLPRRLEACGLLRADLEVRLLGRALPE